MLRCGCWCDKATTTGAPVKINKQGPVRQTHDASGIIPALTSDIEKARLHSQPPPPTPS